MTKIGLPRDANRVPMATNTYWGQYEKKTITFDGGTANAIGDHDGTGDPFTIFTVTGNVMVKVLAECTTDLVGASATLEVGVTSDTAEIIAQTTAADIVATELWHDASPDSSCETSSVIAEKIIVGGADIIGTVGTANITAGVIDFFCYWLTLEDNASVVAA